MEHERSANRKLQKLALVLLGCTVITACNQGSTKVSTDTIQIDTGSQEADKTPSEKIQFDVGTKHTNIKWEQQSAAINFYRFSNKDCDIKNYAKCNDSQLTIINSINDLPIEDSFLNEYTKNPVYIKMSTSGYKSDVIQAQAGIPQFPPRNGMQMVNFNDHMFIIGGQHGTFDSDTYYNDIWSSKDGITWKLESEKAEFSARSQHKVVEFDNKLWLFSGEIQREGGGFGRANDVWNSEDGIHWKLVYENLPIKSVVVFKGRIWAFAEDQIFSSETGDEWVLEESNWSQMFEPDSKANPSRRFRQQYAVFKDKIWMIAGQSGQDGFAKNDVWSTVDGLNWVNETANAQFNARLGHAVAVFKSKLWISGGYDTNNVVFNDIWSSENGVDWTLDNEQITQKDHQNHQVIAFDNKLWLYGEISDEYLWQSSDGKNWYVVSSPSVSWTVQK